MPFLLQQRDSLVICRMWVPVVFSHFRGSGNWNDLSVLPDFYFKVRFIYVCCVHHRLENLRTSGKVQCDSSVVYYILIIQMCSVSEGTWGILPTKAFFNYLFFKKKWRSDSIILANLTDSKEYIIHHLFLFRKYVE